MSSTYAASTAGPGARLAPGRIASRFVIPPKRALTQTEDRKALLQSMSVVYGVTPAELRRMPIFTALIVGGCRGFYRDLCLLTADGIRSLKCHYTDPVTMVNSYKEPPATEVARLIALVAYYHDKSYMDQKSANMLKIDGDHFFNWPTSTFDPATPIVPWNKRLIRDKQDQLTQWKKAVRLDPKAFPKFKNSYEFHHWWKEHVIKLQAYDLQHFLDLNHVVVDEELDENQRRWMMNVLVDIIICPQGRSVLLKFRDDLAVREFYNEFYETLSSSMTSEF